ncbi:MAG TPA: hypothetical protein VM658_04730 [bacterium]|nr:hypothetical protein [bacterium]
MKALRLIHSETEGAGTIGDYLASIGAFVENVALYAGAPVPPDASAYDFIVSMGGPMNVYEEEMYPFLKTVLQWHEDTFDPPAGAVHLARSELCPRQAFRCKNSAALQFHLEVNHAILSAWVSELRQENQILEKFPEFNPGLSRSARQIYENFFADTPDKR